MLLPGVTVLARLVARVRDRAASRLWRILAALPTAEQRAQLEALLRVPEGTRHSPLDRLRQAPTRVSGPALVDALQRLTEIRAIGIGALEVRRLPPSRLTALARYAAATRAQAIARMPEERRLATLLAFAYTFETTALDDALDLLDLVITDLLKQAQRLGQKERLQTIRKLDAAALQLRAACEILLDDTYDDAQVRAIIFARIPRLRLVAAAATVDSLARPPEDNFFGELVDRYRRVRRFLPTLLRTVTFDSIPAGQPLVEAVQFLAQMEQPCPPGIGQAPLGVVSSAWRRWVLGPDGQVDRRAYTLCVLERLQDGLRRRDAFVPKSDRWGDPRAKLLSAAEWTAHRSQVCQILGRQETAAGELRRLEGQLDEAWS